MPQKNKLDDHEDLINEQEITHKKIKTDGNGTSNGKNGDKNGNDTKEKIIDGVQADASVDVDDVKNDDLGVLLICGGVNWDLVGRKELPKGKFLFYWLKTFIL